MEIIVFDWLFDGFWVIAFLLAVGGAACATAWWRARKRPYAIGAGVCVLLLSIYIALYLFIETSSRQMEGRVSDMAASVERRDIRATLEKHLTDDFRTGHYDKRGFIEEAQQLRDRFGVDKVVVWDFKVVEIDRDKGTARCNFNARPIVAQQDTPFYLVKAVFVIKSKEKWWEKEEWKMQSFDYFNPLVDTNSPLSFP